MRRAMRSAFKIVLRPAGEGHKKCSPLRGSKFGNATPSYTEKKGVQSQFSFLP